MDENELIGPFARLLEDVCTPAAIRAVEAGGPTAEMWAAFEESGFLDALTPEEADGAGLSLADVAPLLQALGAHAVPLPVGETMVARALLGAAGVERPTGPIVLATLAGSGTGFVPLAAVAEHVLVQVGERLVLAPVAGAQLERSGLHGDLAGRLSWSGEPQGASLAAPVCGLRAVAAVVRAAAIAGAGDRLLGMTVGYANERVQFGKPIGKQQALQQNLAVMAEQVVAARIASQLGCAGALPPTLEAAAVAKQVASAGATLIADTAHAVHGAIGVSEEFDLQLYSRRLREWRLADGSEGYWSGLLGARRLAAPQTVTVDFIRELTGG
jgi:acyl-CoA dehydrogenase